MYELSTKTRFPCLSAHDYDHDPGTEERIIRKGKIGERQQSNIS